MLVLSPAQLAQFQIQAERNFEVLARGQLRRHFGEVLADLGDEASRHLLQRALLEAQRLGLALQPDVMKYVFLVFEFGPQFPGGPGFEWAQDILNDGLPDLLPRLFNAGLERAGRQTPDAAARSHRVHHG